MQKIGMSKSDIERYSFLKILSNRAMGKPFDGVEAEASQTISDRLHKSPNGLFIPMDVLMHRTTPTDIYKSSPTAGGDIVAEVLLGSSFIELLVNAMQVKKLGAITLDGLVSDIDLPKQTGKSTATWVAENVDQTPTGQTFGQVKMSPRTVTCGTSYSRKLLLQSAISIEQFVRMDLARTIGLAVDYACIKGDPDNGEPQGIIGYGNGVGDVAMGEPDGAVPTYAKLVEFESNLASANALVGNNLGYLTNSAVAGKLKLTPKIAASTFPIFCWEGNPNLTSTGEGIVNGYRAVISNQVPSNLSKGGSSGILSAMIFGAWDQLIIGQWGNLDILIDPFTLANQGGVIVRLFQDVDIALRHGACFSVSVDIKTA